MWESIYTSSLTWSISACHCLSPFSIQRWPSLKAGSRLPASTPLTPCQTLPPSGQIACCGTTGNKSEWTTKRGKNESEELLLPFKDQSQSMKESVFLALALTIHPRPAERTGDKTSSRLKTFIYPFCDRKENIYSFTSRSLRIAGTVKSHWQWQNINSYYSGDFIDKERPPQGTGRGLFKCSFAKES